MGPFDIKSVLLAKHAQHVVLVHFPIALFLTAVIFDLLARRKRNQILAKVAYYNFTAAATTSLPVVITGVLAWYWQLEAPPFRGILLLHLLLALVTTSLIWATWWIHRRAARLPERPVPGYRLFVETVAAMTLILTAHLGGFLSGVNS